MLDIISILVKNHYLLQITGPLVCLAYQGSILCYILVSSSPHAHCGWNEAGENCEPREDEDVNHVLWSHCIWVVTGLRLLCKLKLNRTFLCVCGFSWLVTASQCVLYWVYRIQDTCPCELDEATRRLVDLTEARVLSFEVTNAGEPIIRIQSSLMFVFWPLIKLHWLYL